MCKTYPDLSMGDALSREEELGSFNELDQDLHLNPIQTYHSMLLVRAFPFRASRSTSSHSCFIKCLKIRWLGLSETNLQPLSFNWHPIRRSATLPTTTFCLVTYPRAEMACLPHCT